MQTISNPQDLVKKLQDAHARGLNDNTQAEAMLTKLLWLVTNASAPACQRADSVLSILDDIERGTVEGYEHCLEVAQTRLYRFECWLNAALTASGVLPLTANRVKTNDVDTTLDKVAANFAALKKRVKKLQDVNTAMSALLNNVGDGALQMRVMRMKRNARLMSSVQLAIVYNEMETACWYCSIHSDDKRDFEAYLELLETVLLERGIPPSRFIRHAP